MLTYTVYKHTNTVTGKSYVGVTKYSMEYRWKQHLQTVRLKTKDFKAFHNAIAKYGEYLWEHTIIVDKVPKMFIQAFEKYWIDYYDSFCNGYNSTLGGDYFDGYSPPKGENHHSADLTIYMFLHKDTKKVFTGTHISFAKKYNIKNSTVNKMLTKTNAQAKGWILTSKSTLAYDILFKCDEVGKQKRASTNSYKPYPHSSLISFLNTEIHKLYGKIPIEKYKMLIRYKFVFPFINYEKVYKYNVNSSLRLDKKAVIRLLYEKAKLSITPKEDLILPRMQVYPSLGVIGTFILNVLDKYEEETYKSHMIKATPLETLMYKEACSRRYKGKNNPMYGKPRPQYVKDAVSKRRRNEADKTKRTWMHVPSNKIEKNVTCLELRDKYPELLISKLNAVAKKLKNKKGYLIGKTHKGWKLYEES